MRRLANICACAAVLGFAACGEDSTAPALPGDPATLTLSAETVTLTAIGAAERLTATVSDASGIALADATVSWSSGDDAVAAVDGSGRIEAVGVGETEITAAAGGASDAVTVVVTQSPASVAVSPAVSELGALGDSVRYAATVRDANGNVIPGAALTWTSADTMVATVDAAGWVTAQANGTTTVTAAAGKASDEAAVVVEQVVASVDLTPAADSLGQGQTIQFDAAIADANGATVAGGTVVWTTSDPTVATVDAAGRVTGIGWAADATVTATVDGTSGTANVHLLDQLLFYADGAVSQEVYVMHADGSGRTDLTSHTADERVPAWSPDGARIAFASNRTGDLEIYVMDADGSDQTRITNDAGGDYDPAWSPDGTKIAFRSSRDGDYEIFVMNADGSDQTQLTSNTVTEFAPDWSPDGSQLAFASYASGDYDVWVMNADGSSPTNLTGDAPSDYDPVWSPDGTKLAFYSYRDGNSEIYVMNSDGSNLTRLTNDGAVDRDPAWSPDGTRIAFASDRDGNDEIYVMNADGTGQMRLTDTPVDEASPRWRPRP